ncbi:hypothetical protein OG792_00120 [Micromonospora sp. NBC_01699]|uniref:hypothetical protein n=1 Tax=Micromonospora sp. NBC_01699 TaxID=2975984 RepID=UPI002E2E3F68|nr:hypothetical protein [Micromonospora sp. NBC_01699]
MGWQIFIAEMTGHLAWPTAVVVVLLIFRRPLRARISQLRSVSAGSFGAEFGEADRQVGEAVAVEAARSSEAARSTKARTGARPGPADPWATFDPPPEALPEPTGSPIGEPTGPPIGGPPPRPRTAPGRGAGGNRSAAGSSAQLDRGFRDIALRAEQNPAYAVDAAWSALEDAMSGALNDVRTGGFVDRAGAAVRRQGVALAQTLLDHGAISPVTYQAITSLGRLRDQVTHGSMSPQPGAAVGYVRSVNDIARAVRTGVTTVQQDQHWGVT